MPGEVSRENMILLIGDNSVVVSYGSAVFREGRNICVNRRWLHVL